MKQILKVFLSILLISFLSSCAVHSGLTFNTNNSVTNVVLQGNNYKIIQKVKGEASGFSVLGIFGGSFRPLVENARSEMLRKANLLGHSRAIINETVEVNNKFFVIVGVKTVTVSAYVIEFTGDNSMQQATVQQPTQQIDIQPLEQLSTFLEQKTIEPNAYLNFNEYKKGTPSLYFDFKLSEQENYYRISNVSQKADKEIIEKEIWGVRVKGVDYINTFLYQKSSGYQKIAGKGYYSYFRGYAKFQEIGYVILPTGNIQQLTPELLLELCKDNQSIVKEIQAAKLKKNDFKKMFEILRKYNLTKE